MHNKPTKPQVADMNVNNSENIILILTLQETFYKICEL